MENWIKQILKLETFLQQQKSACHKNITSEEW